MGDEEHWVTDQCVRSAQAVTKAQYGSGWRNLELVRQRCNWVPPPGVRVDAL